MPKFVAKVHVEPDTEMGPGEPDKDDAMMSGKRPGMMKAVGVKPAGQFGLPPSPKSPKGPKGPAGPKGPPKGMKDGKNNR